MKYYTAFGLTFKSDIDFPELLETTEANYDVVIKEVAKLSKPLIITVDNYLWTSTATCFMQQIPDIGDFLVEDGRDIEFVRLGKSEDKDLRIFLLGSIMGALLQQRGLLTLHASSIKTNKGAVLFMGRSGAGKSTLLNAFLQKGKKMLSDDISAINLNKNDAPEIVSAFPRSRLWADSAEKLNYDVTNMEQARGEIKKYSVPIEGFSQGKTSIHCLVVLTIHNESDILLKKQTKHESFCWMKQYTYRKQFMRGNELMKNQFKTISALSQQVPLIRVTRPSNLFLLDELVAKINSISNP